MKRLTMTLLFALAFGLASAFAAGYLTIDDSGVDYENTKLSKVYIGLDYVDGTLVIRLDDDPFDGALASRIDFDVPDLATQHDFWGNEFNADISDVTQVRWLGVNDDHVATRLLIGMDAMHLDTNLANAMADYDALFRSLGFTSSVMDTVSPSVKVVTFTNGATTVSARLHAHNGDVSVELRSI